MSGGVRVVLCGGVARAGFARAASYCGASGRGPARKERGPGARYPGPAVALYAQTHNSTFTLEKKNKYPCSYFKDWLRQD